MSNPSSWERFVESRTKEPVRLSIAASWLRSDRQEAARVGTYEEYDPDDLLLRAARRSLRHAEDALSESTTWIALANARGVVTYEWAASHDLHRRLVRSDVAAGSVLTEGAVGTNGVGVALATQSTSVVNGAEHYKEHWRGLICAATTIVHPVTKQLLGAVNITSMVESEHQHVRIALDSLAMGIRQSLTSALRGRHQRLLDAHLRVKAAVSGTVVTLDDQVMIDEHDSGLGTLDRDTLWSLVQQAGMWATSITLPNGQRARIIPIDRGTSTSGCSLIFDRPDPAISGSSRRELGGQSQAPGQDLGPIALAERDVILAVLRDTSGNRSEAAERLRISRGTLYDRIRRYGIELG